jgi:elongation factor P--beta-lysine ligase
MSDMDSKRLGECYYHRPEFPINESGRVHENYYKKIQPRDAWILQKVVQSRESTEQQ